MFTDIAGFTRLTQENEALAIQLRGEHQTIVRAQLLAHEGREVKTLGDGFLIEFPNVIESVRCAADIQKDLANRNAGLDPDREIRVRIGIHVGDVVADGDDLVGDTVNIASRVESSAGPGEIWVSGQVADQVRNKLPYLLEELPPVALKNVAARIALYRVSIPAIDGVGPDRSDHAPRPVRLAILPFLNISPDPSDSYFAEGLTEELIATVSRIAGLRVIARTSVMRFRDGSRSIAETARELRVSSLLEGSVRRAGDDLRVTAQLIDVATEEPVWSMRFDRRLENVFAIQEELARRIAESLHIQLVGGEGDTLGRTPTRNLEAYDLYLQGRQRFSEVTAEGFRAALSLFERATILDPEFALAYCGLAEVQAIQGNRGFVALGPALERAERSVQTALRLNPDLGEAHAALAPILYNRYDWPGAVRELDRAIALEPNNVQAHFWRAVAVSALGYPEDGLSNALRAVELDPLNPRRRIILAQQYFWMRQFDRAIVVLNTPLLSSTPDTQPMLAYALLLSGRPEEARAAVDRGVSDMLTEPLQAQIDQAAIYARAGKPTEAREILTLLLKRRSEDATIPAGALGWIFAALGEFDSAADWYIRAHEERSIVGVPELAGDPFLDAFRTSARYPSILRLFGLLHGPRP